MSDIPDFATNNAHMFYIVCNSIEERTTLIKHLKENGILSVFHYLSLHLSDYYKSHYINIPNLPNCDRFADCLLRLPMFYELSTNDVYNIISSINTFYK